MKILLNFLPLKSGGGVQVALDFVAQAKKLGGHHHWYLVATSGTPLARIEETANFRLEKVVSRSLPARLWFEYIGCRAVLRRIQASVVYTQFGPQWPGARRVTNVVGCAYSNLLYPEVDFWAALPPIRRGIRKFVDIFRKSRLYGADLVIFETDDLAARAVRVLQLPSSRVAVARPAASVLVSPQRRHEPTARRCEQIPKGYRIVLLSVYNPNKNIELLPAVAKIIKERYAIEDFAFVITLPTEAAQTRAIMSLASSLGVREHIYNIGPVPHEGCAELYLACNAVVLPSQLESFSNNIGEAWIMRRPLLISDLDWARSICGDAAVYFRYADAQDMARAIVHLRDDERAVQRAVDAGSKRLANFPTSEQRFLTYLELIEGALA